MLNTTYFPFAWELTGCLIERDVQSPLLNRPFEFETQTLVVYNNFQFSRIVQLSNHANESVKETNKQENYEFLLYLDRAFVDSILEGDKVKFKQNELGLNQLFIDDNSENVYVGYINKIIRPQAQSLIGSLECYISTNY